MTTLSSVDPAILRRVDMPAPTMAGESTTWSIYVYAHTHWDREWYRTYERFRMQLVGMVDRVLHTLDSDPAFTTYVLDGQTIVLDDYLAIRPEEEPRIRRLVQAGRLEIGPWHVLPDEFLVSGESFVRNLLEGRRVASRFGPPLAVGYLPDPFGHIAQLPAILRGFGIDNVIFSRGTGDEFARTGSEFRWEALDGSDVLAILQAAPDIMGYWSYELGGRGNAVDSPVPYDAARRLAQHLAPSASTDMMLFAAGADHDTIHANLPAIVANLRAVFGDQAEVRLTGLDAAVQHVRRAEQRIVAAGGALQRHRGEMRGSRFAPILASIFSARVELKQQNDALQQLLERHVEPLMASAVAAGVRPARDVEPFLRHAWRLTLENHPHDSIGGCSVDLVHEEMPARTLRATEVALGLVEDLRMALGLGDVEVVHDAEGRGGIAERADGTIVALAPGPVNALVPLAELQVVDAVQVTDDGVSAGDVSARVADVRGRPMLELSFPSAAPVVVDFLDEADGGDEYDFSDLTGSGVLVARIERWQTQALSDGAVGELEVVHVLDLPISLTEARTDRSPVTTRHELVSRVRVSTVTQLVEVHTTFTNAALDHRLRVRVTPASPAGPASPDHVESLGHFAIVERPVRPADPATTWRQLPTGLDHTLGAVRLVDESGMPLVLAAGRGIHEYEAIERSDAAVPGVGLELTLVRSVGFLSRDDIAGRPEHAGPALATPGAQCQGARRVDLAFGAGPTASFDSARAFLAPPLVFDAFTPERIDESGAQARRHDVALVTPVDARERIERLGLVASGSGVVVSALKLADDGSGDLIARWWAPTQGNGGRARLHVGVPVSAAWRARLDETAQGPATFDENGMLDVAVRPGSIVTVRVSLAAT